MDGEGIRQEGKKNKNHRTPNAIWNNKGKPFQVNLILNASFSKLGIESKIREHNVKKVWKECVGANIAKNSAPAKLIGKTLYCTVTSSPWMTELSYQRNEILSNLNKRLGEDSFNEIVFKMGSIKPAKAQQYQVYKKRELNAAEKEFIDRITKDIKDDGLKNVIKRALEKYKS